MQSVLWEGSPPLERFLINEILMIRLISISIIKEHFFFVRGMLDRLTNVFIYKCYTSYSWVLACTNEIFNLFANVSITRTSLYIVPRLHNEFLITLSCNYNYQHYFESRQFHCAGVTCSQQTDLENLYILRERHKSIMRSAINQIFAETFRG